MTHTILLILATVLLVPGIIMAIIPAVPGMIYMLLIALAYGAYDHFTLFTWGNLGILAIISAVAMLVDTVSGLLGAKWGGAHWSSVISGVVGLILGSLLIPIPIFGSLIGMFFGILATEWYRTHNMHHAKRAATGSLLGSIAGTGFKIVAAIVFVILFVIFALY